MTPRYLTKSRFKLAMECPAKLFYTAKRDIYYDSKTDNDFLKALAEGGFQVGELAKKYFPGGTDIESLDYETALAQTWELLQQEDVIIYEAAFRFNDLFIRADIVEKRGGKLHLIEVKAKSIDPSKDSFTTGAGGVQAKWKPYLEDIAFQKYVLQNACPELDVSASLLLTDKTKVTTVDGLNQLFLLSKEDTRTRCHYTGLEDSTLGEKILTIIPVDSLIEIIYESAIPSFEEMVALFADKYKRDEKISPIIGGHCGKCEFKTNQSVGEHPYRSGFHECWKSAGVSDDYLRQPLVLDLWNFREKDSFIKKGVYLLRDLNRDNLEPKTKKKITFIPPGLSKIDRQVLQIEKVRSNDRSAYLDKEGLKKEMNSWVFPLHFIDFETTAVAIPFNKGSRPYEQVAFQYSHHVIEDNGTITHKGEWLSTETGKFPNFDFVRALKKELENDNGTIFRYAIHENTILNVIHRQLKESKEPDRETLCAWIETITYSSSSNANKWAGKRAMIDLLEMVKLYYYDPRMEGSNSIKKVLPAILATSDFLKMKYGQPIYGAAIKSINYKDHIWIKKDSKGDLINPYLLLPAIHPEADNETLDDFLIDEDAGIADGGAAMIAFAKMQFTEMSTTERNRLSEALLRYCELDTMAMVMIYEAWKDWCTQS